MLKKLTILMSIVFTVVLASAQTGQGTIKGKMTDKATGEPLPFANVIAMQGGAQIAGTMTDFDGKYTLTALPPGSYTIEATYVGYQPIRITGVLVNSDKITFKDVKAGQGIDLTEFEVVEYEVPLISKDQTSSGGTVTREDIAKMPGRSAASIAATVGGVYTDANGGTSIRGARTNSTDTYIDGIKVRGSQNLPASAIEQVTVVTGGLPAQYGDVTGGVISISTRGAAKEWFGGVEYLTSGFKSGDDVIGLDNFGFNLLGFSLSGPLLSKKDSLGNRTDGLLGFFLSGEFKHELDTRPLDGGDWKVKDDKLAELQATPLVAATGGGVNRAAEFLKADDLEKTPFRLNAARKGMNLAGKIDINTSKTTTLTFGGSFDYTDRNSYLRQSGGGARAFSMLNFANNPQTIDQTWRVYGRFTQRFKNSEDEDGEKSSLIKNAFVSFQVDYTDDFGKTQDEKHQGQLGHYGYVGKFTSTRENTYLTTAGGIQQYVILDDNFDTLNVVNGWGNTPSTVLYEFEAGDINPILSNYTQNYYDIYANDPIGHWERLEQVENEALLNGSAPDAVYEMWNNVGTPYTNYQYSNDIQFRASASGSADVKDHAIKIGFEYEQRVDKFYQVNPNSLWEQGRRLTNAHLQTQDFRASSGIDSLIWSNNVKRYTFKDFYNAESHSQFDKNMRRKLGYDLTGLDFIDFDSYGPDLWNVSDFSADELLTQASSTGINYYGYDHTGKELSGNPSLDDFFNDTDDNGNKTRTIAPFRPIYVAGYIQDKFAFDDLVFNVGVRIDRYDANQPVLKDPYLLFPAKTVGEVDLTGVEVPSNIGTDYMVYVSNVTDPAATDIVGYRNGDTWYNKDGVEISNGKDLASDGVPKPWLVDPNQTVVFEHLNAESFKDYEPQVNVSPRVAFSFPISDEALFFAHYDVLTQRPSDNRIELIDYLVIQNTSRRINNPNLKPEKTIDYELGFQQKLSSNSSLKLAAFYREQRDMIQVKNILGAYPSDYISYENLDFGTVKGMTVTYDLRRKGNFSMTASYTLQFADGTGSGSTSGLNFVSSGKGNLRSLSPLNFDERHAITMRADYRYGKGKDYNGPVWFGKDIFANTGVNLTGRAASGTPYTKKNTITNQFLFTTTPDGQDGSMNGSRLPWSTNLDLKVDRNIDLKWGKGEDEDKKTATLNVYFQILNVLNTQNVVFVNDATGSPSDDGYLSSAQWQSNIESQLDEQSFRDLYNAKMDDPRNYSLPRRIRLGMMLNF